MLSQGEVLKQYPVIKASYSREALFFPQEVSLEPDLFIHRLHQYFTARFSNLEFLRGIPVIGCEIKGSSVHVSVPGGKTYKTEKVVIASGHEFRLLFPELFAAEDISLTKLQMVRTVSFPDLPLEGNIATGLSIRRYEAFAECPSSGTSS